MATLASRVKKLESRKSVKTPRRVISVSGSNPTSEEIRAFLAPFGIDADGEEDFVIVIRALVAPEAGPANPEIRPGPHLPLRFSQTPDWIKAHPAYEEWMSR